MADKISIIDHRDCSIVTQCDLRGPDHGYLVTVEWHGEECSFNTVDEARSWIDSELDTDFGFDPIREWGIGASRAI